MEQEDGSKPLYKVTGVRQDTMFTDGHAPVASFLVTFDVLGKPGFTVELPESDFGPDATQAAVEDVAMRIAAALTMEGERVQFDEAGRPVAPVG